MPPENQGLPNPADSPRDPERVRRIVIGLLGGSALLVIGALISWRLMLQDGNAHSNNGHKNGDEPPHGATAPAHLFPGWAQPELAIVLSGQMKGYLQPCGCTSPQKGGLARRYWFMKSLEKKGWPVVAVDLGDLAQTQGPPHDQILLKYTTAMHALRLMRYTGVGVGKGEFAIPLHHALAHYALNNGTPAVLAANIAGYPDMIRPWAVAEHSSPRVGVVGLVTKSLREQLAKENNQDKDKFASNTLAVLSDSLKEMGQRKVELGIILVQGKERHPPFDKVDAAFEEAKTCAEEAAKLRQKNPALAPVNIVLWTAGGDLTDPPAGPTNWRDTLLITLGHKGKSVGVVGVFRNGGGKGFTLKYQVVDIGPEYETPEGQENDNPVIALMEDYALDVKKHDYMAKFARTMHPVQVQFRDARYVGSERCGNCHEKAYEIWAKNKDGPGLSHARAYDTLVDKAKRPSLRQFDGECVVCHTVGFEHKTGFYDPKNTAKLNKLLHHVGCESCHGPGSEHIRLEGLIGADPGNAQVKQDRELMHRLMNPHKASAEELNPKTSPERRKMLFENRMLKIDFSCQKCHDQENDVHWNFNKKWPEIIHMTPAKKKDE